MDNKNLFYQESGNISLSGLIISYIFYFFIALILGYAYSVIIVLNPIAELSVLITLGFSLILGVIARIVVRFTHNRNKRKRIIQAVVFGILVNCFQWILYVTFAIDGEIPSFANYFRGIIWFFRPLDFFDFVVLINKEGMWSVFGIPFNGFMLTFIWIIEIGIIIFGPFIAIYKTKIYPYSEMLRKWYPKFTLNPDFRSVGAVNNMIKALIEDPIKAIDNLDYGESNRYCKVHIFYVEREEKQYLTFENIFVTHEGKKESHIAINNFTIDKPTAEVLLDKFDNNREKLDVV